MVRFYSDLRQWTFADEVDGLRNGEILAMLSRDNNRLKPSVLTLSTWWLNAAWTALYWDTGIISAYDYRSRISAWRQYPQLAPEFDNIVEVDWYKLFSHAILHEVCILSRSLFLSADILAGSSRIPGWRSVEMTQLGRILYKMLAMVCQTTRQ